MRPEPRSPQWRCPRREYNAVAGRFSALPERTAEQLVPYPLRCLVNRDAVFREEVLGIRFKLGDGAFSCRLFIGIRERPSALDCQPFEEFRLAPPGVLSPPAAAGLAPSPRGTACGVISLFQ
jgi:hypothetical protein